MCNEKILSVIVVLGQMLAGASAVVVDDQPTALTPEGVRATTQELQALKSNILAIQEKIKEHKELSEMSTPPFFCKRFVGDRNVANLDLIEERRIRIESIKRQLKVCSDEAKKSKLADSLVELEADFCIEMEKKAQYESAITTLLSLKAELDSCVAQMQTIVQKASRDKPVSMQERVVESSEVSVISMAIAEAFFNRVFSIANEYVLARAKKLDIQNPPLLCVQYTNDSKVRNAEAIQMAEQDLNNMQQIVNVASNEDKAELQAILDRQQAAFDAKMANVIAYEEKVNAFVAYQGKVNECVGVFTASFDPSSKARHTSIVSCGAIP